MEMWLRSRTVMASARNTIQTLKNMVSVSLQNGAFRNTYRMTTVHTVKNTMSTMKVEQTVFSTPFRPVSNFCARATMSPILPRIPPLDLAFPSVGAPPRGRGRFTRRSRTPSAATSSAAI